MLTEDVAPNRLERTKFAIRDLVQRLHGDRIGFIAFAGESFLMCPLTSDYAGFILSLENLSVNSIPRGGTNVSSAIQEAERVYKNRKIKNKVLVILTDGDNLEGDPVAVAKKAKSEGIKIYTVGIGTRKGELIRISDGRGGMNF
jgi:Ca-activated chloride channel family protein